MTSPMSHKNNYLTSSRYHTNSCMTSFSELCNVFVAADTVRGIWIGGEFDEAGHKFVWVDGRDVTFHRYKTGSPRNEKDYRLLMVNPAVHKAFAGWPWTSDIDSLYTRGYICEVAAV